MPGSLADTVRRLSRPSTIGQSGRWTIEPVAVATSRWPANAAPPPDADATSAPPNRRGASTRQQHHRPPRRWQDRSPSTFPSVLTGTAAPRLERQQLQPSEPDPREERAGERGEHEDQCDAAEANMSGD